ncbi:MAG: hypothetical protein EOM67_07675 [Spirochaetia bacterium]|nr:hypothetical protein [Spirochaetia bacterium]
MKKNILLTIIATILISTSVQAAVDPAWYDITFILDQHLWLSSGDADISYLGPYNNYLGSFGINRNPNYASTSSWINSDQIWGPEESTLTFVYTSTTTRARLEHVTAAQKYMDLGFVVNHQGSNQTLTQTTTIITESLNWYLGSNVGLQVTLPNGNLNPYKGSYTSFLNLKIYAEYGTSNQLLLGEFTYPVALYYKKKSNVADPIVTNLTIDRYPSADNINVPLLQQTGNSLLVGSVTFTSNDSTSTGNYSLKISPKINPTTGDFAFYHQTSPSSFTYKVHVPGRTNPSYKKFSIPVPTPSGNNTWYDFIEIGISGVNIPQVPLLAGEYQSEIVIELEYN